MRIGIIAEGRSDIAVLENILFAELAIQRNKVDHLRPELILDETDLDDVRRSKFVQLPDEYSNCALVFKDCREQVKILGYLGASDFDDQIDEEKFVVVHVDTAECHESQYGIVRPERKDPQYFSLLCSRVIAQLSQGYSADTLEKIRWAIAVEEIEAWLLAIWHPSYRSGKKNNESVSFGKAKEELKRLAQSVPKPKRTGAVKKTDLNRLRKKRSDEKDSEYFHAMSVEFRDRKKLHHYAERNLSLKMFVDSLASLRREKK